MTTAVIGATGRVGSEVVRGVLVRGDAVTVLVRDHGKARRAFGEPDGLHIRLRCAAITKTAAQRTIQIDFMPNTSARAAPFPARGSRWARSFSSLGSWTTRD